MKIAIIGSGISGVSVASLLKTKGHDVTIFEKQDRIGGLIQCDIVDGNLFHKVGGHVFNSKEQHVLDWFWRHFYKKNEFYKAKRNAKIWFDYKLIGYPIENYLYQLEKNITENIIKELLSINQQKDTDYQNFQEFLIGNFGPTLYKIYFKPYNEKIWSTELSEISLDWLAGKLPMPNLHEIIMSNILQKEEANMVHSYFFYPKKGGSQFIIDRLSKGLKIKINTEVSSLYYQNELWILNNKYSFDSIVYTGDIRNLAKSISNKDISSKIPIEISQLRSNGTSNVLCYTDDTNISWLYIPDKSYKAHRIIYTGNFSPNNNADQKRKTCVVEFSGKVNDQIKHNEIKKLPGNLEPIKSNYQSSSYVIQDDKTKDLVKNTKEMLAPYNMHLCGRFAEWEYYNMDKAIEAAMLIANRL